MARRKRRRPRKRRPRGGPHDDPGLRDRLRWRREAREILDSFEPKTPSERKLHRLLVSLATFLERGHRAHLGAEGVWGVYSAFREIAEECAPCSPQTPSIEPNPREGDRSDD